MVHNTSDQVLDEIVGPEHRRIRNQTLEKAGLCLPGAGLIYVVDEGDLDDFDDIDEFSERVAGETGILNEKMIRLVWRLLVLLIFALTIVAILWPGVMEQHEAVLTILISKVGPTLVVLYIWRELIDGAVYAKWNTIKLDRLEVLGRVNDARRRLPVVAGINADGLMVSGSNLLNSRCHSIVTRDSSRMWILRLDCVVVILLGLLNCIVLICWF